MDAYERDESPNIRISRNGSVMRFAETTTASPRAPQAASPRYYDEESLTGVPAAAPLDQARPHASRERPMPRRLSEEAREVAEAELQAQLAQAETPPPAPKRKGSKRKTKGSSVASEETAQIPLPLKVPRAKPDSMVRQRQVLGFCCIVLAILVLLAIISYSPDDASRAETKISDLPALFMPHSAAPNPVRDAVRASADQAKNWLGLIGAILANFLINKTIGFAAILYPIFFGAWSLAFFRFSYKQRRRLTLATTFFLLTAVLFSATMGTVATFASIPREWSGSVGQFLGLAFSRAIGGAGAFILYGSAFVVMLIFSIDLDIEKTFVRLHRWWATIVLWSRKEIIAFWDKREARLALKEERRAVEAAELIQEEELKTHGNLAPAAVPVARLADEPVEKETKTAIRVSEPIRSPVVVDASVAEASMAGVPMAGVPMAGVPMAGVPMAEVPMAEAPVADVSSPISMESLAPMPRNGASIRQAPVADARGVDPGQPLLKVRPAQKHERASIPRLTHTGHDQLGSRSMHFNRLTNGALEAGAESGMALTPNESLPDKATLSAPIVATVLETSAELPVTEDDIPDGIGNVDMSEEVIDPLRPRKKPIKTEFADVQVGDEKTLANEALPHSVSDDLGSVVSPIVKERGVVADLKFGEGEAFFEEGEKPVIPENPYLEILTKFRNPSVELLTPADPKDALDADDEELAQKGRLLRDKLATFGVDIENITVTPGPVVTLYEFTPAEGIKVSRVENLTDDIALAMKARGIRIIAPIPGKGTIGVEIPNDVAKMVRIRPLFENESFRNTKMNLPLALGKTISGDVYVDDLNKMPHLLIAGATGSGKSVGVNGIIASLLYAKSPRDVKFVIVDPKKIELSLYKKLRKHYLIVSPEAGEDIVTTPAYAVLALKAVEIEMERRYDKLAKAAVRSLADYNIKVAQGKLRSTQDEQHYHLPYIVVIIDELADLMITAAKEIEEPICRIAQMARAVGIHMILATQRPSVDVITGVIKANFPARMAYQVATRVDSRTILDVMGAEQLMGNGDMLYLPSGTPKAIRLQSPFISTEEVELIVDAVAAQDGEKLSYSRPWTLPSLRGDDDDEPDEMDDADNRDELFEEAAKVLVRHQQGSVSLLQRRLRIGYSRAARVMDELESAGIVGPFDGSKARQVLCENEAELEVVLEGLR